MSTNRGPGLLTDLPEYTLCRRFIPEYDRLKGALYRSRAFNLDADASAWMFDRVAEITDQSAMKHTEDWRDDPINRMIEFARPPFDPCYVEFDLPLHRMGITGATHENESRIGLFVIDGRIQYVNYRIPSRDFPRGCWAFNIAGREMTAVDGTIESRVIRGSLDPEYDMDHHFKTFGPTAVHTHRMLVAFFLLMYQPGAVEQGTTVPRRSGVVAGKPRTYMARTSVSINLGAKLPLHRGPLQGERSTPRRHSVRGTWVHHHLDRSCTHEWQKEPASKSNPDRIRYRCALCDALRTWRPPHYRGDAGIGFVSRAPYQVTHKSG